MESENKNGPESTLTLLRRAKLGDREALATVYRRYFARLERWAHGRLPGNARHRMDTTDVVQQALTKSLQHVASFEGLHSGAFHAYVRTGVLNLIRDELRGKARRPQQVDLPSEIRDPSPSPLEKAIGRENLARYEKALSELDPGNRQAVVARLELGLTYAEIAEEIGKPSADAARMTVCRAIERLANLMREPRKKP